MSIRKLRFQLPRVINVDGKEIETRVVYGDFPFGYGKDYLCVPEIVIDKSGEAYRKLTVCSDGSWMIVNNGYLKRLGLTRKQLSFKWKEAV